MAMYPTVPEIRTSLLTTQNFYGLDYRAKIPDGCWNGMANLTSDEAPMLASRNPRTTILGGATALSDPGGLLGLGNGVAYVDNGTLYWQYQATGLTGLNTTDPQTGTGGEHQLVAMGGYILVFPEKKYYNTLDETGQDFGDMGASWTCPAVVIEPPAEQTIYDNNVLCYPCDLDGNEYKNATVSATAPEDPANGDVWIDTSNATHTLSVYSEAQSQWVEVPTVYTKIIFTHIGYGQHIFDGTKFSEGDVVTISGFNSGTRWEATCSEELGLQAEELNGEKELIRCGHSIISQATRAWCIVIGILDGQYRQNNPITIQRVVPTMNFVCEAQNRIWGCYYGLSGTEIVNEIYASALGDFKNWRKYQGISTDSWAASVGSPGPWTGAVNYLGHPLFFKEQRIHEVSPSSSGAHSLSETICRGIEQGSWRSAVVVDETLYYKSPYDVCMYQGALPKGISENFGVRVFHNAVAGGCAGKYYISMQNESGGGYSLFVYDTANNLWHREDGTEALYFANVQNDLFYLDNSGRLVSESGKTKTETSTDEAEVSWYCVSGFQNWQVTTRMYVSRYVFRVALEEGATFRLQVRYDAKDPWEDSSSENPWIDMGTFARRTTDSFLVPVRPRRCDHIQFRLSGVGKFRLYSMTRYLETGSDL